jgi:hypothetical protein
MNLKQLYDIVERSIVHCERRHQDPSEVDVCIKIESVGAVGGIAKVDIKSVIHGWDWDSDKLIIYPEEDLSLTDHDYLTKIRKEIQNLGWDVYEFNNLKRENKKLIEQLSRLNDDKI